MIDETRLAAVEAARETVGWPFQHAGRSRGGIDCVGVVFYMMDTMGWANDGYTNYPAGVHGPNVLELFRERMDEIHPNDALPADVILTSVRRYPAHSMILTERDGVIHARWGWKVVEHGLDDRWSRRVVAAFRVRELSNG